MKQHKNGVSPRNQSFHTQNGESICCLVGIILAGAFWAEFLTLVITLVGLLILLFIVIDLWRNI